MTDQVDGERPVTVVAIPEAVTPVVPPSPMTPPVPRPASERSRLRRPDSVMSITGQWPVPQIIVYYREMKIAWGREAIAALGKTEFMKWLFITFIWTPPDPSVAFTNAHYEGSLFAGNAVLFGTFYHTFGKDDAGPVMLGSLGWAELIRNVARIELIYNDG
ncbi:hypothetical protein L226DRAFT_515499 [Lentinus tigrinus ALCF2SS1-7]|uniref:Uncharacterized protein n=1 Tax=Lentinus tigrinus ALCF2SS1-6 TaxID=1328759 RepID=A0A5C2RVD9_9APHY|nr:hypothetical protein L227DRAFT_556350 [Lentinus tigrinus ALCF2SS1-6]RPD69614.1 hypothetical protein L226DRAFT_515499 [Lentinus tigrinus ALCF2SS1-7]